MESVSIMKMVKKEGYRQLTINISLQPNCAAAVPEWEDGEEIHLRDYLDVVVRRKWPIICILAISFITTLIFTLASTKIYKATATIEVTQETSQVTKFEQIVAAEVKAREFYETQVALLLSQTLIERVIEKLNLMTHPIVVETVFRRR